MMYYLDGKLIDEIGNNYQFKKNNSPEELKQVEDFKYHYDRYKKELANNLKTINCMQEEATTNYNLINSLEDRNDRLVERLEKQKAKLKELTKDNHSLTKTIAQLTEADYYFITSMALDMLKGNSNFALMYLDDIFCLVDTKNNSFEVIDNYDIDTENIGKSKYQKFSDLQKENKTLKTIIHGKEQLIVSASKELTELKKFVTVLCKMKIVDSNHKIYGLTDADIELIKKVVEKYGKKED